MIVHIIFAPVNRHFFHLQASTIPSTFFLLTSNPYCVNFAYASFKFYLMFNFLSFYMWTLAFPHVQESCFAIIKRMNRKNVEKTTDILRTMVVKDIGYKRLLGVCDEVVGLVALGLRKNEWTWGIKLLIKLYLCLLTQNQQPLCTPKKDHSRRACTSDRGNA